MALFQYNIYDKKKKDERILNPCKDLGCENDKKEEPVHYHSDRYLTFPIN
jgi:hypothetical protein